MRQKRMYPELRLQIDVIDYLTTFGRSELKWFAIPNGDMRHVNVALRLKAQGVVPGVADICIMLDGGRAAWLELKSRQGVLSDYQAGFAETCARLGHYWGVARSLDDAVALFVAWNVLRPDVQRAVA